MKILITGATGFVGTALVRRIRQEGWRVRCAVRTVSDQECLPREVEAVPVGPIGPDTVWTLSLTGADIVIHLAARTHITREMISGPLSAYRLINVAGTERLARAAAASGVRRFIYLSSVKVNGEGKTEPYTEQDSPAPEDAYGTSKWEAEQALHSIAGKTGMEIVIIRPPLVYGPGVKANFLELVKIVNRGIPLPFANVQNRRSFIALGNLVSAVVTCSIHPEAAGQTYLVSDSADVSTPELIRKIARALGRPARLFPLPVPVMRIVGRLLGKSTAIERLCGSLAIDSSKISRDLRWHAPITMERGLQETADWFNKNQL